MTTSNLPATVSNDSSTIVREFFDKFYQVPVSFPAAEIDAVVAFFQKRNFDLDSARTTAIVMLNQARADNIKVFQLLDSLKVLTDLQLTQVVTQVLNSYRENTSLLGYRTAAVSSPFESRNVLV
jgi:S-adenosylmethionine:diacylglycerol 3-amino-3-carboxypropyl transferase